jgi:hypothetical protein
MIDKGSVIRSNISVASIGPAFDFFLNTDPFPPDGAGVAGTGFFSSGA